jgi:DNA-binding PucR family transcriptional regulator
MNDEDRKWVAALCDCALALAQLSVVMSERRSGLRITALAARALTTKELLLPRSLAPRQAIDLEFALSKARAARILVQADADYLQIPVFLKPGEEKDIRAWIQSFAEDALDEALEEAEEARQRIQGPPVLGSAAPRTAVA